MTYEQEWFVFDLIRQIEVLEEIRDREFSSDLDESNKERAEAIAKLKESAYKIFKESP